MTMLEKIAETLARIPGDGSVLGSVALLSPFWKILSFYRSPVQLQRKRSPVTNW